VGRELLDFFPFFLPTALKAPICINAALFFQLRKRQIMLARGQNATVQDFA
jgi:hypothetical protein